jgi:hypothetical protein
MSQVEWKMKGHYLKNCNCIASCPCDTAGVPAPYKGCEGMGGMEIVEGHFGNVPLNGLKWVAIYHWPGALHEGNGTLQPLIDERATPEQRNALLTILSGKAGDVWFEILASIVTKVHEPKFVPIHFEFDKKKRRARVMVPGFLETVSEPLRIPANDKEQRVIVNMPEGMEYKEFEVAAAAVLKGTGTIRFDHHHTHSSLADVEHTQAGLIS